MTNLTDTRTSDVEEKLPRHMMQVSGEAYEFIRKSAFDNRRKMNAELDVLLGITK